MIYMNIDLAAALELKADLEPEFKKIARDAARDLAVQAHAHIVEEVQSSLHSTREKYIQALHFEQEDENTWVIGLDKDAMWIEEGMEEHSMVDDLLASPKAKTSKDGTRYLSVPFQHNKNPTQQTIAQQDLKNTVKSEMKRRQIPMNKIEKGEDGKPKIGLIHSFDVLKMPTKTKEGPGQGKGPVGQVRQGPTGIPFLQGVRVYQKHSQNPQTGHVSVQKSVMTFRTVSSKHRGTDRWVHPGLEAKKFFDRAADWALQQWETKIVPDIIRRIDQSL